MILQKTFFVQTLLEEFATLAQKISLYRYNLTEIQNFLSIFSDGYGKAGAIRRPRRVSFSPFSGCAVDKEKGGGYNGINLYWRYFMGKFDGYLILSDVDGTFHLGDTIDTNSEAVRYFTENGGRFSFATGRTADYLLRPDLNSVINAPACLFNGSVVYDYRNKKLLQQIRLAYSLGEFFRYMKPALSLLNGLYAYDCHTGEGILLKDLSFLPDRVEDVHPLKLVCTSTTEEEADRFRAFALESPMAKDCYISKSWHLGVEFNPSHGTKGDALDFIKAYLGNIHTAIGIGDYENDIPLLTHADIGIAVDNAQPAVKAAARKVICHAGEYALRELITLLEEGKL